MFQINKSSSDFWNSLKLTWQQCDNLPSKVITNSVAELNGKVYIESEANYKPLMYDSNKDQWSTLPALPHVYTHFSLVTVPDRKQPLAIGGMDMVFDVNINKVICETSNKVFVWDEEKRQWTTPYPNMPTVRF